MCVRACACARACVCVCECSVTSVLSKRALIFWGFPANTRIFTNDCSTELRKCQQHDTVGAQSCMCELTVAVTTSREEKHTAVGPKTYSEKRVKCH